MLKVSINLLVVPFDKYIALYENKSCVVYFYTRFTTYLPQLIVSKQNCVSEEEDFVNSVLALLSLFVNSDLHVVMAAFFYDNCI